MLRSPASGERVEAWQRRRALVNKREAMLYAHPCSVLLLCACMPACSRYRYTTRSTNAICNGRIQWGLRGRGALRPTPSQIQPLISLPTCNGRPPTRSRDADHTSYKTHTTRSKQSTPQPPRGPAGRRAGSPSGDLYEVRMSTRNFRAHDAPATERHGEMARSGRLTAVSKSSGCLCTLWQCNRTLDLFCAMGTTGVHLACLCAPSRTS
jgi:hypothetical protein